MLFIENLKNLYNLIPNYLKDIYSENHYLFLTKSGNFIYQVCARRGEF